VNPCHRHRRIRQCPPVAFIHNLSPAIRARCRSRARSSNSPTIVGRHRREFADLLQITLIRRHCADQAGTERARAGGITCSRIETVHVTISAELHCSLVQQVPPCSCRDLKSGWYSVNSKVAKAPEKGASDTLNFKQIIVACLSVYSLTAP